MTATLNIKTMSKQSLDATLSLVVSLSQKILRAVREHPPSKKRPVKIAQINAHHSYAKIFVARTIVVT